MKLPIFEHIGLNTVYLALKNSKCTQKHLTPLLHRIPYSLHRFDLRLYTHMRGHALNLRTHSVVFADYLLQYKAKIF